MALGYHNVIPDDEDVTGEPSIHVRLSEFARQVDLVASLCDVVPLPDLVASNQQSKGRQRLRVSFTFDDAYRGAVRFAVPLLLSRGYPATVFVPTGMMGGHSFWWDDLPISGWDGDRKPLNALQGYDRAVRSWATQSGFVPREQGPNQISATWDELTDLVDAGDGLVTVGLHTMGHPNLAALTKAEIREELLGCRDAIEAKRLPLTNVLAFPYGLENDQVAEVARALGIEASFKISGGVLPKTPFMRHDLSRAVIPSGLTRENFVLRLYGVIPG